MTLNVTCVSRNGRLCLLVAGLCVILQGISALGTGTQGISMCTAVKDSGLQVQVDFENVPLLKSNLSCRCYVFTGQTDRIFITYSITSGSDWPPDTAVLVDDVPLQNLTLSWSPMTADDYKTIHYKGITGSADPPIYLIIVTEKNTTRLTVECRENGDTSIPTRAASTNTSTGPTTEPSTSGSLTSGIVEDRSTTRATGSRASSTDSGDDRSTTRATGSRASSTVSGDDRSTTEASGSESSSTNSGSDGGTIEATGSKSSSTGSGSDGDTLEATGSGSSSTNSGSDGGTIEATGSESSSTGSGSDGSTERTTATEESDSVNIGIIAGAAGGGLVVVIVIIVTVLLCKRRRSKKQPNMNVQYDANYKVDDTYNVENAMYVSADIDSVDYDKPVGDVTYDTADDAMYDRSTSGGMSDSTKSQPAADQYEYSTVVKKRENQSLSFR